METHSLDEPLITESSKISTNPLFAPDTLPPDSVRNEKQLLPALSRLSSAFSDTSVSGSKKVIRCLYVSHALSAWADQMWAYAVTMFFYEIWPESLTLVAQYGLVQAGAQAALGSVVGKWIDDNPRLYAVLSALLLQNGAVAISGIAVIVLLLWPQSSDGSSETNRDLGFYGLVMFVNLLGGVAALADQAGNIAVERDWVIVVAGAANRGEPESQLATINGIMRRIDLTCVLVAPIAVGLVMEWVSSVTVASVIAVWNVVSGIFEYWLLHIAYHALPDLAYKRNIIQLSEEDLMQDEDWYYEEKSIYADKSNNLGEESMMDVESELRGKSHPLGENGSQTESICNEGGLNSKNSLNWDRIQLSHEPKLFGLIHMISVEIRGIIAGWKLYFSQKVLLPALALACLYFTVLNFGELMTAALRSRGVSAISLAVARGAAAIMGIVGTIIYPRIEPHIGKSSTGLWAIWLEWIPLLFCLESSFYNGLASSMLLIGGVVVAKMGIWMFELTVVQMMQETVEESVRGKIGGIQSAMQQFSLMLSYICGLLVPDVENFWILVLISVIMSSIGVALHTVYFFKSLKHESRSIILH